MLALAVPLLFAHSRNADGTCDVSGVPGPPPGGPPL